MSKSNNTGGADSENYMYQTHLYRPITDNQWPIVYHPTYNISFLGFEKLHPFDAGKWGRIAEFLINDEMLTQDQFVEPLEATTEDLLQVHTESYINSLNWSANVARVTELKIVACLPNCTVQKYVLRPFRYQVAGSILAARLALERGWAINIGGGFHHGSSDQGSGFCPYADITMAIKFLQRGYAGDKWRIKTAMIVDLDAHQGNGHGRDFMGDESVYILDVYNRGIYPNDTEAKGGISRKVELRHYTDDEKYLGAVRTHVHAAMSEFQPDLVLYNAGTDCMDGDPLGMLSVSPKGIVDRDEIVFQEIRSRNIPIVMLTSGGYQRFNARVIADSIQNLVQKNIISGPSVAS